MTRARFDASSNPEDSCPGSGVNAKPTSLEPVQKNTEAKRTNPFLGIHFKCCKTYGRIYRNQQRTAYRGRCPKCLAVLSVPIGPGGSDNRFLTAD